MKATELFLLIQLVYLVVGLLLLFGVYFGVLFLFVSFLFVFFLFLFVCFMLVRLFLITH